MSGGEIRCEDFGVRGAFGFETQRLNFELERGQACAVVGRPGSGKSLIFESMAGIARPHTDTVGTFSSPQRALVPQDARLTALPTDRVWSLVGISGLGVRLRQVAGTRWPASESEDRASLLMERLRLAPDRLAELSFRDLSACERRGILLCRALLEDPPVLLLDGWDEMTDGPARRAIAEVLTERMREGLSVIFSSRRYPLRDFPDVKVVPLGEIEPGEVAVPLIQKPAELTPHSHPLLELNRVSVTKPRLRVLRPRPPALPVDGASLFVRHGETVVLLGVAGSGKTTLLQTIAGLHAPSRGSILVTGQDVTYARGRRARRLRRDVQLVFQDAPSALDGNRTVEALFEEAMAIVKSRACTPSEWLERVGLPERLLRARADQLSASESQRVDLARSLVLAPRLVLFDAPGMSAADCDGGLLASLLTAEKAQGRAFLIATTDPEIARSLADRVAVIHAGRIVELGTRREVLDHPGHPVTEALLKGTAIAPTDPTAPNVGCPHVRLCERRKLPLCREQEPMLAPLSDPDQPADSSSQGQRRCACFNPRPL